MDIILAAIILVVGIWFCRKLDNWYCSPKRDVIGKYVKGYEAKSGHWYDKYK